MVSIRIKEKPFPDNGDPGEVQDSFIGLIVPIIKVRSLEGKLWVGGTYLVRLIDVLKALKRLERGRAYDYLSAKYKREAERQPSSAIVILRFPVGACEVVQ